MTTQANRYSFFNQFSLDRDGLVRLLLMETTGYTTLAINDTIEVHGIKISLYKLESWEINPRLGAGYKLVIEYSSVVKEQHVFGILSELERTINLEICRSRNFTQAQIHDIIKERGEESILIDDYYVMGAPVSLYQFKDFSGYYLQAEHWSTDSFQCARVPKPKDVLELIGKYAFWKMRRRKVKK